MGEVYFPLLDRIKLDEERVRAINDDAEIRLLLLLRLDKLRLGSGLYAASGLGKKLLHLLQLLRQDDGAGLIALIRLYIGQ